MMAIGDFFVHLMRGGRPDAPAVEIDSDARDAMDARLASESARLHAHLRREAEWRRFKDEYEARRPRSNGDDA